jgi:F-type H+-transporting ATPase subunit delta
LTDIPPYGSLTRLKAGGGKIVVSSAVLGRYCKSLADIVFEESIEEQVTEDLRTYGEIFRAVPDVLDILHSPAVPRETKEKLLSALMAQYPVHKISSNFLRTLLQHNRIGHFEQILDGFLKAVSERKGIISAQVTAAMPLSQNELKSLEARLVGITGKVVNVESQTDPGLLGGMVVQIGNTIFDGSIRTQLAEMKRRLTET